MLGREVTYPEPFARLSRTPIRLCRPAPRIGEHTEDVLTGLLGMTRAEIQRLKGEGVLK